MNEAYHEIMKQKLLYPNLPKHLVNSYFALTDFDEFSEYGSMFCPFHDDESGGKPSAKFFQDEDGIQRLYCFSERRQYTAYDYIELILKQNPLIYLVKNIPENELLLAIKDCIATGKIVMKKSVLKDLDIASLSEIEFVNLICKGEK